ncbi:hypothetical protein EHQ53_06695 [Leptospira langatensis]|uniref:Lipoprotein n=1 Tax=Leptospira langatensis TaxID=2484983 RepID=A0A5F1ZVL4_9LEPT|nr:hypothetical protein [Leptospira langatensis]TGK03131.1 hypothetical protein EHO57_07525 [Leptospira langatensis]TGL41888.1 hypothetical protein EHQ53_06695 [Leptospira langatensis]
MNRKKRIYSYLVLIISSHSFLNCVHKNPHAAEYFEKYFLYQDVIQKEFKEDSTKNVLSGNPDKEAREKFYKKDDHLILGFHLSENGNGYKKELAASAFTVSPGNPYSIYVDAQENEFHSKKTFKIKRTVEMISPETSVFDMFPMIDGTIHHLKTADAKSVSDYSELQRFLCSNFECSIRREDGVTFLTYTLSESMKEKFPIMYKKWHKRLKQLTFRFQLFQPGGFSKGLEFYNEGQNIILGIPDSHRGYWSSPKTLHLRSYVYLSVYGLKIDVRGLGYTFKFHRTGNTDIVTGEFTKMPETNIGGRFLSILPPSAISLFVPSDLDEYFEDMFELLVNGSDGKGGNRFETRTKRNGSRTKVVLTASSEIFRDRFLPFKSQDEDDEPAFSTELGNALVKDLRGK